MIPAAFDYRRPASVDDALAALSDGKAKVLAGGMSLLPLMKLRLASPGTLVDIGRLAELRGSGTTSDGGFWVGALATYADILETTQLDFARDCILGIGDVQVRNRGTVGGAVSHADPASDLPALGLALDYSVVLRSARGERTVPLDGFFVGAFQTGIAPDELLVRMVRAPLPAGATGAYRKMEHPASGYSIVGVCAVVVAAGGSISHARVALTGVGEVAYRAKAVEAALLAGDGSAASVAKAAEHATDGQTVNGDIHADRDYRARMAVVYTRRAIDAALGR
ncbi:MAG TPA: xanthine dehydrogenase family protein subunit M [Candidatus Limnocylindrales bacterium]|nr:xanthine dehydrogenase family protein subunit M [Candidatus Limnocylindrales bacterium]